MGNGQEMSFSFWRPEDPTDGDYNCVILFVLILILDMYANNEKVTATIHFKFSLAIIKIEQITI